MKAELAHLYIKQLKMSGKNNIPSSLCKTALYANRIDRKLGFFNSEPS